MVMYDNSESDLASICWMNEQIEKRSDDERYLYFRFKRWN